MQQKKKRNWTLSGNFNSLHLLINFICRGANGPRSSGRDQIVKARHFFSFFLEFLTLVEWWACGSLFKLTKNSKQFCLARCVDLFRKTLSVAKNCGGREQFATLSIPPTSTLKAAVRCWIQILLDSASGINSVWHATHKNSKDLIFVGGGGVLIES